MKKKKRKAGKSLGRRQVVELVILVLLLIVFIFKVSAAAGVLERISFFHSKKSPVQPAAIISKLHESSNLYLLDAAGDGFAMYRSGRPKSAQDLADWCQLGISDIFRKQLC